jgi:hypothetical protein
VLRFALDLQEELGLVNDNVAELPPGKVDHYVINNIYGGHNIIAGTAFDFNQIGAVTVQQGDLEGLIARFKEIGVSESDIPKLKDALAADAPLSGDKPTILGKKTWAWVRATATKLGRTGTGLALDVAKEQAKKWILQYLGLL